MDRKIPNDFEAIRASGNQTNRVQRLNTESSRYLANIKGNKNYTNQYISMLNLSKSASKLRTTNEEPSTDS